MYKAELRRPTESKLGTYYSADGSSTMDLISDVERTAPASCYCAFAFRRGFEIPYYFIKGAMFDDLG